MVIHLTDGFGTRMLSSRLFVCPGFHPMPLTRFLQNTSFGPEEIAVLVAAFEGVLRELDFADRAGPAAEMAARKVVELAKQGERDPIRLRKRVIEALSGQPPNAAGV